MNEVKYPVMVVCLNKQSYQWLTLEQANERFVVIDNQITAEFLLEQYQRSLADSKKYAEFLCEDNERFISELQPELEKCKVEIKNAEHAISFLKQAIVFLNS